MPVQLDGQGAARRQIHHAAVGNRATREQLGHHAHGPACGHGAHLRFGARHEQVVERHTLEPEGARHKLGRHVVLAVERQERHVAEVVWREPLRQMLLGVAGRGHGHIVHGPERHHLAAAQRLLERGHAAQHLARAQPFLCEVLVVHDDFERQALAHQVVQRAHGPGGDAVGVDGDRDALVLARAAGGAGRQLLQVALQVGAQQAHLLGVLEQQLPRRCGPQRPAAHDEHRAHLRFERAQALRHGRLRDIEALRCALETALFNDGSKAFEGGGVVSAHGSGLRQGNGSRAICIRRPDVFGVSLILLLVERNVAHTAPS